jgi:superoxide dismutase, Cu-Zn family
MKQSRSLVVLSMLVLLATFGCAPGNDEMNEEMEPMENDAYEEVEEPMETTDMGTTEATATLTTADGTEVGTVTFTADDMGGVAVSADFHDLEGDGTHGFHIHEGTECSAPTFESAGGHFNPENTDHACPPTTPRHAGDFGNVTLSGGSGTLDADSDLISLEAGMNSVIGKAVILHAGEDDCTSQPSGAAGDRLACGIITAGDDTMMDEGTMGDDAMEEDMAEEGDEGAEY